MRKLSGDWDSEAEYRKSLKEEPSYIDGKPPKKKQKSIIQRLLERKNK